MFVLLVELEALPAHRAALADALLRLVQRAGDEPGVCVYAVQTADDDPNGFFLYEMYLDRTDWERHMQDPVAKVELDQFDQWLAKPPRLRSGQPLGHCFRL